MKNIKLCRVYIAMLTLKNVFKSYEDHSILSDISFTLQPGKVMCIIGPSGGGKSTILRVINKLDGLTDGEIVYSDITLKNIAMVFQNFNLFKNMSVIDNITYPLMKVHKMKKKSALLHAEEALRKVGMYRYKEFMPRSLSGGQQQRSAIARAIATHPKLILFDEPTSALDPENVKEVLNVIRKLKNVAMLIVTHEMKFAEEISDKIIFLESGKVLEITESKQFFKEPKSARARSFLKKML